MRYIEIFLLMGLLIILPLDFKNILVGTELTTFYLTITGFFYLSFGVSIFLEISLKKYFLSESYKGIKTIQIIGTILASISIGLLCYAVNMKFTDFPGATFTTIISTFSLAIIISISLIKYIKYKNKLYRSVLLRTILFMLIGIVVLSISKLNWIKSIYSEHPEYIKASEAYFSNTKDSTLQKTWEQEFQKIQ